jgi:ankyrin repeat protein
MHNNLNFLVSIHLRQTIDIIKILLINDADVNIKDKKGRTALMKAVLNAHTETIKVLLENGADVNIKSDEGFSAFEHGKRMGTSWGLLI